MAVVSPARDINAEYKAWGHSTISNPYGEIIAKAAENEEIIYAEIGSFYFTYSSLSFFLSFFLSI